MRRRGPKILSIIPAAGWKAAMADLEAEPESHNVLHLVPLVCWALVADVGGRFVIGMGSARDPEVRVLDDGDETFLGYVGPGDEFEAWEDLARKTRAKIDAKDRRRNEE